MEVGIDDSEVKSGEGDVERSCYCIHAPIHEATGAACVLHTHMPYATALWVGAACTIAPPNADAPSSSRGGGPAGRSASRP